MEKIKEYGGVPKKYIWIVSIIGCLLSFILATSYYWYIGATIKDIWVSTALTLGLIIAIVPVHEFLHGMWFKIFTGHVTYGFILKKFVFYASAPQEKLSRNHFILVALFPQVIAIPCFIVWYLSRNPLVDYLVIVVFFMNSLGGVSDIWAALTLSRYDKKVLVEDTKTGMAVYQKV
jgi:hypothetical protein